MATYTSKNFYRYAAVSGIAIFVIVFLGLGNSPKAQEWLEEFESFAKQHDCNLDKTVFAEFDNGKSEHVVAVRGHCDDTLILDATKVDNQSFTLFTTSDLMIP